MNESGANRVMKWFILLMTVFAIGAGGAAYYFHAKDTDCVTSLRGAQVSIYKRAYNVNYFLRPSLARYYELVRDQSIPEPPKSEDIAETPTRLNSMLRDTLHLGDKEFEVDDASSSSARSNQPFRPRTLKVSCYAVNRATYESVLNATRDAFGSYATISTLKLDLARIAGKKIDYTDAVAEDDLRWDVKFELTWNEKNPEFKPARPAAGRATP